MKLKFLVLGLLAGTIAKSQPVYNWAKTIGSTGFESVSGATSDIAGNVYITGTFNGTVDFDPGPGTQFLTCIGADDAFICKFDVAGNLLWVKSLDLLNTSSIAVDAAGNVYTTGNFGSTPDFDPGPGVFNLTYKGIVDVFVLKLNAAGDFVWAKAMGGTGMDHATSIAVDAAGNVYTAGQFVGPADFDPGPGVQQISGANSFVSILNASGNYVWAGPLAGQSPNSIALDGTGNVYITGYFFSGADFDPGTGVYNLPNAGGSDAYISKLDASGNFVWAKGMGGSDADFARSLTLDASGNIYITGSFVNAADFDPGTGTTILTTPTNASDVFVSKLDASGNLVWAKNMGGDDTDEGCSIQVDALGNVYTAGSFENTADFDPNAGTQTLAAASGSNYMSFFSKLDASGNYVWAFPIGNIKAEQNFPCFLIANGDDNIYAIGDFFDHIDLDPGSGTQDVTAGDLDFYIVHLTATTLPLTLLQIQAENNDKTVLLRWVTTQEENTASFSVERSANSKNFIAIGSVPAANTAFKNNYVFSDAHPLTGTSFYRLKMIDINGRFTYSNAIPVRRNENEVALLVSPNPAKNFLYVQAKGSEQVTLQITDVNGRILQQQKISLNGTVSFSINIQPLPPGSYYLVLKGREIKQVQQFLKQ